MRHDKTPSGVHITSGKADFVRRIKKHICEAEKEPYKYIERQILERTFGYRMNEKYSLNKIINTCLDECTDTVCLNESNEDVSQGCINNTVPVDFNFDCWKECHINSGGDPELAEIVKGLCLVPGELSGKKCGCVYCYGALKNQKKPREFKMYEERTEKYIQDKKINIIRLGKLAEFCHREYDDYLMKTLESGLRNNVQFIVITKDLAYDPKKAELFRETKSVIKYSIGGDVFEIGACLHKFNNAARIEDANKYLQSGVNACLNLLTDLTIHPEEADKLGWKTSYALENFPKERIELLPLRIYIYRKRAAIPLTGASYGELQMPIWGGKDMYWGKNKKYVLDRDKRYIHPDDIHKSYSYFIENKQICGHIGTPENGYVFCDMCQLTDDNGGKREPVMFHMREFCPSPEATFMRRPYNIGGENRRRLFDKAQGKLIFEKKKRN